MVKNTIYNIVKLIAITLTVMILSLIYYNAVRSQNTLQVDPPFDPFYCNTLQKYNRHIQAVQDLPEGFVSMEMLESIGTFNYFYYNRAYGLSSYRYELVLENGYTVEFDISHTSPGFTPYDSITAASIENNMLSLNSEKSAIYTSNNLVYRYIKGRLYSIEWTANGIWYDLSFPESFSDYPPFSPDSIVGKLTSKSPALQRQALRQLPDAIGNVGLPLTVLHTISQILPFIPLFVCIAAVGPVCYLLAPRFRKEHDHPKYYANDFRNL